MYGLELDQDYSLYSPGTRTFRANIGIYEQLRILWWFESNSWSINNHIKFWLWADNADIAINDAHQYSCRLIAGKIGQHNRLGLLRGS